LRVSPLTLRAKRIVQKPTIQYPHSQWRYYPSRFFYSLSLVLWSDGSLKPRIN